MARTHGKGKVLRMLVVCIVLFLLAGIIYRIFVQRVKTSYERVDDESEILYNPLMGFAPNADYIEAVGDNTLVYVDVTWRELEPTEGVYDFTGIEESNYLERWRSEGKRVVFRFVCDVPSDEAHMDIPDWLYEKTGDGTVYDMDYGKGYSPDYGNADFLAYHTKAIEALGDYFGGDSFFAYIELGSLGHWGEWHVNYDEGVIRLPSDEMRRQYVEPYLNAFPNAKLLMRRPFAQASEFGLGVYNDMTGEPESTAEWLSWIENGGTYAQPLIEEELTPYPNIWLEQPVGGEFTSSLSMEEMLVDSLDRTIELLQQSHMTFIGPKCPIANEELVQYPKEVAQILANVGYRYGVSKSVLTYHKRSGDIDVKLTIDNYGTAPLYFDWPVYLYIIRDGEITDKQKLDLTLTKLAGGDAVTVQTTVPDMQTEDGFCQLAIGIEDPDTGIPAVALDMQAAQLSEDGAAIPVYLLSE